ncbi:MAG: alpha/beta fold hydrolase [Proteobacteria bacterium]|nr:alpha/beta fold hydrolase [Pseudomonadota bacterium]
MRKTRDSPGPGLLGELAARAAATAQRLQEAGSSAAGACAREVVWRYGTATLYRYLPLPGARPARAPAVLVCFALVNRPWILDLRPQRSLLRPLLAAGHALYLIDWGDPPVPGRGPGLVQYVEEYLGGCVQQVRRRSGGPVTLLGVCQGGVLSLCYAALHPQRVARLITLTTPVDFHTPDNLLSKWVRQVDVELLLSGGHLPGALLTRLFISLLPLRLAQHKYIRLLVGEPDQGTLEDFVSLERWIFDNPPQAARALGEFVRWFYQQNRLISGEVRLGGRRVDLRRVRMPVLNLYARDDHIVPPSASRDMGRYLGSDDYSAAQIDTGHIGMYVSRHGAAQVPARIVAWLGERT